MLKRQSLLKLLMDKMSSDKDGEFPPFYQHPHFDHNFKDSQPLVFSFGDEDPIPADSSDQNAELDPLWAEFDFALESENIGTYYDDEVRFVLQYHDLSRTYGCHSSVSCHGIDLIKCLSGLMSNKKCLSGLEIF
jgi:hypothetical protein